MSDDRGTGYATRNVVPVTDGDLALLRRLVAQLQGVVARLGPRSVTYVDGIGIYRPDGDPWTDTSAGDESTMAVAPVRHPVETCD